MGMEDESLKAKISEEEKKTINSKCDEALKWLESNQLGEVDEFQDKQKELEVVCNPIISKLYQQGGASGGTMPNGMPGGMPKGSASWIKLWSNNRRSRLDPCYYL